MTPVTAVSEKVSFCRICEALCGVVVEVEDNEIIRVKGDPDHPTSRGYICPKGSRFGRFVHDPERIVTPLKRDSSGAWVPIDWTTALDEIASRLGTIIERGSGAAVALYQGNPAAFSVGAGAWASRFLASIGSVHWYGAASQDTTSRWLANALLWGSTRAGLIPDVKRTDFLLVLGANPLVTHGSMVTIGRLPDELRSLIKRGGRVVVVDPVATKTAKTFEHLPIVPGGDVWLLGALINEVFRQGLDDLKVDRMAQGLDELLDHLAFITPEVAAARSGIDADQIARLARDFATSDSAVAYGRLGVCRGEFPTLTNVLIDVLNLVTGNVDRVGGALFGLPGKVTVDPEAEPFGRWHARCGDLPEVGGRMPWVLADEIRTPGPGQVKALIVCAGNPILSAPGADDLAEALHELDLHVAIDVHLNETNQNADYFLPATTFMERADHNFGFVKSMPTPWLQYTDAVLKPQGEAREEWWIYEQLLWRLGHSDGEGHLGDVLDAATYDVGDHGGEVSMETVRQSPHGMKVVDSVPVGSVGDIVSSYTAGARRLATLDEPSILQELRRLEAAKDVPGPDLRLVGRRDLRRINSWLDNVQPVTASSFNTALLVHPHDAESLDLASGSRAVLASAHGEVEVDVEVSTDVRPGTVCYPHGLGHNGSWTTAIAHGGSNVSAILPGGSDDKEQVSGMSRVDDIPVRLRKTQ